MVETRIKVVVFQSYIRTLFRGKKPTLGTKIDIADGISLMLERSDQWSRDRRERAGGKVPPPEVLDFVLFLAKDVALPIALGVVSNWIYDKLKRNKALVVTVNGIRLPEIREQIKEILENELGGGSSGQQSTKLRRKKTKKRGRA